MNRIDPTSNTPVAVPSEATTAVPLPPTSPSQPVEPEQNRYAGNPGRDFGRLKALSAASLDDEELACKERDGRKKRRGYFRKKLAPKKLRGKAHPAAADERYQCVFPWRAHDNQLHVCAELADPADASRVDPGLRLARVAIDDDDVGLVRRDIKAGLLAQHGNEPDALRAIVNDRYDMLLYNLHASLENTMRGESGVPAQDVYARELGESDLAADESALKGQYGLFNRRGAEGKWRTVAEGLHLCFFGGVFCRDAVQYQTECERYAQEEVAAYALMISGEDYPCISPYGGGDLGQFANSAITRDWRGRVVENPARTNARFACVTATFEDNRPGGAGRLLAYPVVFLYMLADATHAGDEREARVSYGQPYWDGMDET